MVELRCDGCPNNKNAFCTKLKQDLPSDYTKFHHGGALGTYAKNKIYPSKCGIEKTAEPAKKQPQETLTFYVVDRQSQEILVSA